MFRPSPESFDPTAALEYVQPGPVGERLGGDWVWLLRKNCSFSPRQVLVFYLSISTLSFAMAAGFALQGLWMVLPFSLIENLALGAALLYYARHALDRECVRLHAGRLTVEVVSSDTATHHEFDASRVRLEWDGRHADALWLRVGKRRLRIGTYLTVTRRRRFAQELQGALRSAWMSPG